ncbi:hypothetical protein P3T23_008471 [Paraburkholderia sp. GAS448]|uniref:hypothetical protein n=1 Tax=Paraburkholderia sp. GAS448 TaxID=3035136 RepID=UPI003D1C15DE
MSTHANAEVLLAWLRERSDATVHDVVTAGLLTSRRAAEALQYAVRNGALERVVRSGASAKERTRYRVTGVALPVPHIAAPCFDALLRAWGMVLEPPRLAAIASRRHQLSDHDPEMEVWSGHRTRAKKQRG